MKDRVLNGILQDGAETQKPTGSFFFVDGSLHVCVWIRSIV